MPQKLEYALKYIVEQLNNLVMPPKIIDFIRKHHVFTLATAQNDVPHCVSVFYVYMRDENCFAFTSHSDTLHVNHIAANNNVAVNIHLETKIVGKIRGLQMRGIVHAPSDDLIKAARSAYLLRFPYAVLMPANMWIFEPTYAKYTDNRLGFGNKLEWQRADEQAI
jgi:uncharacterized protein YhbP (UPF0306 family)